MPEIVRETRRPARSAGTPAAGRFRALARVRPLRAPALALALVGLRGDRSAPASHGAPALLDELLEALEVSVHPARHEAERVADLLAERLRLVVELEHHARSVVGEPVEGDHARVAGSALG